MPQQAGAWVLGWRFAPGGEELGRIRLPIEMRVFEIGSDYLLGAYDAPDGQELVALYRYCRVPVR